MRAFSSFDILETWERGRMLHPLDRGLLALSVALSCPSDELADWPLGRRNRALFDFLCTSFSSRFEGWTSCIGCGEKVEFDLDAKLLTIESEELEEVLHVAGERFRLPTSRDLIEVSAATDSKAAVIRLMERCSLSEQQSHAWSDAMRKEVEEKMASADPMAEIRLALCCPTCGAEWNETLDIGAFVWAEVDARARRILWEVHLLASAYGWTEMQTLSVPAARRAMYLQMVQA
jgi:hypothetical protein